MRFKIGDVVMVLQHFGRAQEDGVAGDSHQQ
jgi:hypothetical protein